MNHRFFLHDDHQVGVVPVIYEVGRVLLHGEFPWVNLHSWTNPQIGADYQAGVFNPLNLFLYATLAGMEQMNIAACLFSTAHGLLLAGASYLGVVAAASMLMWWLLRAAPAAACVTQFAILVAIVAKLPTGFDTGNHDLPSRLSEARELASHARSVRPENFSFVHGPPPWDEGGLAHAFWGGSAWFDPEVHTVNGYNSVMPAGLGIPLCLDVRTSTCPEAAEALLRADPRTLTPLEDLLRLDKVLAHDGSWSDWFAASHPSWHKGKPYFHYDVFSRDYAPALDPSVSYQGALVRVVKAYDPPGRDMLFAVETAALGDTLVDRWRQRR